MRGAIQANWPRDSHELEQLLGRSRSMFKGRWQARYSFPSIIGRGHPCAPCPGRPSRTCRIAIVRRPGWARPPPSRSRGHAQGHFFNYCSAVHGRSPSALGFPLIAVNAWSSAPKPPCAVKLDRNDSWPRRALCHTDPYCFAPPSPYRPSKPSTPMRCPMATMSRLPNSNSTPPPGLPASAVFPASPSVTNTRSARSPARRTFHGAPPTTRATRRSTWPKS